MARHRHGKVDWYSPDPRAILPLSPPEAFRVSRSLERRARRGEFHITHDQAFTCVMRSCAEPRPGEPNTWINHELIAAYTALHEMGFAHSLEAWEKGPEAPRGALLGGLYGVSIGGAFFGESMFSRATDASKVCLVHLVEHLRARGFVLLDVQFQSPHMKQFGTIEIPRPQYLQRLQEAVGLQCDWGR